MNVSSHAIGFPVTIERDGECAAEWTWEIQRCARAAWQRAKLEATYVECIAERMLAQTIAPPADGAAVVGAAVEHTMRRSPIDLRCHFRSNPLELRQSFAKCGMHSDGARVAERCSPIRHHDARLADGCVLAATDDVIEWIGRFTESPPKELDLPMRTPSPDQERDEDEKNRGKSQKILHGSLDTLE